MANGKINTAQKFKAAERELVNIFKAGLSGYVDTEEIGRNLDQSRDGGHDITGVTGWCIECKRCAKPQLSSWWQQAIEQAVRGQGKPALAYRLDHQPWRVKLRLMDITGGVGYSDPLTATLPMEEFIEVVKAGLRVVVDEGIERRLARWADISLSYWADTPIYKTLVNRLNNPEVGDTVMVRGSTRIGVVVGCGGSTLPVRFSSFDELEQISCCGLFVVPTDGMILPYF